MIHKRKFRLNDVITFDLGDNFLILDEKDDEGNRNLTLVTGPDTNGDGETVYRFNAKVSYGETDGENHYIDRGSPEGTAMLDAMKMNTPNALVYRIEDQPTAQFLTVKMPLNFGGHIIKLFGMGIQVPFMSNRLVSFVAVKVLHDDYDENLANYEDLLNAAKTIRVRGEALNLKRISAATLMQELTPEFEEDEEGVANLDLGVKLRVGDGEASDIGTITYNRDGSTDFTAIESSDDEDDDWDDEDGEWDEEDVGDEDVEEGEDIWSRLARIRRLNDELEALFGDASDDEDEESGWDFPIADPDEYLYSHYGRLKREYDKLSRFGTAVINGQGTDFQPLDLLGLLEQVGKKSSATYKAIKAASAKDAYALDRSALKMAQVFRVEKSAFNQKHDREAGICVGMYEKKYMLSALRSFAWTLAQTADDEGRALCDYDFDELSEIGEFIEAREWLNYESGSWFDGLCGHSDIHVIYVPRKIIDDGLDGEIESVLRNNPVCSLDALRSDLAALEGVMAVIHNGLLEERDRSEALEGALADVLTTWCALCVAAKKPFFSEDGPMMYYYSYPEDSLNESPVYVSGNGAVPHRKKRTEEETSVQAERMRLFKASDGREHFVMGAFSQSKPDEPIEWIILKKESGRALALSLHALYANSFGSDCKWENSRVRSWLNEEFYEDAFDAHEKDAIIETRIRNSTVQSDKTTQHDDDTTDCVFLLNADEALTLLPTAQERVAKATQYAKRSGAEISDGPDQCHWWLRGPGFMMWAARIQANGEGNRWGIYSGEVCVRPAMWVDLSKFDDTPGEEDVAEQKSANKAKELVQRDDFVSVQEPDCLIVDGDVLFRYKGSAKKIILPDGITAIRKNAFLLEKELEAVVIPQGVITIGECVFCSCENLTHVELPSTLEEIGAEAFRNCKRLKEIRIPGSVKVIENEAFSRSGLESIVLPDGLEKISAEAFGGCESLKEIRIPDSVKVIENEAFSRSGLERVVLPDGLEKISAEAFWGCKSLKEIRIPDSVRVIENEAFGASGLKSIALPDWLTEIGDSMFTNCDDLEQARIPDSVERIDEHAFYACAMLAEIKLPAGLHEIGVEAFAYSGLKKVVIPDGVKSIEDGAFYTCGLEEIYIPDSVCEFGDYVFEGNADLVIHTSRGSAADDYARENGITVKYADKPVCSVAAPRMPVLAKGDIPPEWELVIDDVTEITEKQYEGLSDVVRVVIGNSVKRVSNTIFYGCPNLRVIVFRGDFEFVPEDGDPFFYLEDDCPCMEKIVMPRRTFEHYADAYCLTRDYYDIVVMESVATEEEWAEAQKPSTRINTPEVIESLIAQGYTLISSDNENIESEAYSERLDLEKIVFAEGIAQIGRGAFEGCENLREVCFPASLKEIDSNAFKGCPLNEIILPQGFEHTSDECFFGSRPRRIVYPRSCFPFRRSIYGNMAFDFEALRHVERIELPKPPLDVMKPQNWLYCVQDKVKIQGYTDAERNAYFEENSIVDADGILKTNDSTEMESRIYSGRYDLERVVVPEGIQEIGSGIFKGCVNLRKVVLPESLRAIGSYTFGDCINLREIHLPENLRKIDYCAFDGCTNLQEIRIPASVDEIGYKAFDRCDGIKKLVIPEGIKMLPNHLVSGNSLEEVVLPDSVVEMEREGGLVFYKCPNLKRIRVSKAFKDRFVNTRFDRSYSKFYVIEGEQEIVVLQKNAESTRKSAPEPVVAEPIAPAKPKSAPQVNPNAARIENLKKRIQELEAQRDSIGGLFGSMKRKKVQKEIDAMRDELDSLR